MPFHPAGPGALPPPPQQQAGEGPRPFMTGPLPPPLMGHLLQGKPLQPLLPLICRSFRHVRRKGMVSVLLQELHAPTLAALVMKWVGL